MAKVIGRPFPKGVSGNPKGRPKEQRTLEQRKKAVLEQYRRNYPNVAARLLQLEMRVDLLEGQLALTSTYANNVMDEMLRQVENSNGLLVVEPTAGQLADTMSDAEVLERITAGTISDAELLALAPTSNSPEVKRHARLIAEREIKRRQQQAASGSRLR